MDQLTEGFAMLGNSLNALFEGMKKIKMDIHLTKTCARCQGTGKVSFPFLSATPDDGMGQAVKMQPLDESFFKEESCDRCAGSGETITTAKFEASNEAGEKTKKSSK